MLGELLQMFNPLCCLILVSVLILLSLPIEMLLVGFSHGSPPLRYRGHDLAERKCRKLLHDGKFAFLNKNHVASQCFLGWSPVVDRPLGLHILVVLNAGYLLFNFFLLFDFNVFLLFFPFFCQQLAYFLLILTQGRVNLHQLSKPSLAKFSVFGC